MQLLQNRWKKSCEITQAVQHMMLNMLDAMRLKREGMLSAINITATHRKPVVEVATMPLPTNHDYRHLRANLIRPAYMKTGWQECIMAWLLQWEWAEPPLAPRDCVTWLELLVALAMQNWAIPSTT